MHAIRHFDLTNAKYFHMFWHAWWRWRWWQRQERERTHSLNHKSICKSVRHDRLNVIRNWISMPKVKFTQWIYVSMEKWVVNLCSDGVAVAVVVVHNINNNSNNNDWKAREFALIVINVTICRCRILDDKSHTLAYVYCQSKNPKCMHNCIYIDANTHTDRERQRYWTEHS